MLRVYIKPPGEDWVEYTPIVRPDREFEIGGRAYNGEADQGTITIDDPDLTLDEEIEFGGHREVKITVDDSGSEKVLALGRIGPKSMERGAHPLGRELTLTVEDVNADLRGIIVDKWGRPEETGRQRVAALRLAYLHGTLSTHARARNSTNIDIDDFFPDANTATMPAKFYAGTDPLQVIRECAEWEGKLTFVYPQDNGDKELFYAVPNDLTLHNCTLEVSDDPADVDDVTVFAPWWNAGPALNSDPMETITGLTLIHPDGERTYDNDATAEATHDKWEESMFTEVPPGALANAQLATILNTRTHEEKRRQFSIRLPESKVHLVKQGMLLHVIQANAANIPNVTPGSQKYRISQIRYRWHGPDATDDNAFLVVVTLETVQKLKLRWGRGAQATKPPPTPTPAPPEDPQPPDTVTVIAEWHWEAAHGQLDDTDTYNSNITRDPNVHSWIGPGAAGSIPANHGDMGNESEATDALPVTAGTTLFVSIEKFRWKWDPPTREISIVFYPLSDGTGTPVEEWVFEDGVGRSPGVLYTDIGGTHVVPVSALSCRVEFTSGFGLSVIDDMTVGTIDAADEVVNDPYAVAYDPDCPHESPHFLPSDYIICLMDRMQDQISALQLDLDNVDTGSVTAEDLEEFVRVRSGGKEAVHPVMASGSTETLDLINGNFQHVVLTANCTLTLTGATAGVGCTMKLLLQQDGTGGRTVTWPGSVEWVGDEAPTLQTGANTWDWVTLVTLDGGTTWFGQHTPAPPDTSGTGQTVWIVDPGAPSYSGSGPVTVALTSKFGIDSGGNPYYNAANVTDGEEAALGWDSTTETYFLRPYYP